MPTVFDGDNLIITLHAGGAAHTIKAQDDLYSDWKEWMLLGDNRKYPPAFRTTGGDELVVGQNAGSYYFLQNQSGWRIRPAEENSTINFIDSLIAEDSTLPLLIPTVGTFTVFVNGLQPITQTVDGGAGASAQEVWEYQGVSAVDKESDLAVIRSKTETVPDDVWGHVGTSAIDKESDLAVIRSKTETTPTDVWGYVGASAVDKEDDLIKARKAAENAFAVSS